MHKNIPKNKTWHKFKNGGKLTRIGNFIENLMT